MKHHVLNNSEKLNKNVIFKFILIVQTPVANFNLNLHLHDKRMKWKLGNPNKLNYKENPKAIQNQGKTNKMVKHKVILNKFSD